MYIKVIKTEEEYEQALARLEEIFDAKENTPEADEAELLEILVEKYENDHYPISAPDPIEDKIHSFWDKVEKYLYPMCILLGMVIGYLQYGPAFYHNPHTMIWLTLSGGFLGALMPFLLRHVSVLIYVVLKFLLFAAVIGAVVYAIFS